MNTTKTCTKKYHIWHYTNNGHKNTINNNNNNINVKKAAKTVVYTQCRIYRPSGLPARF